MLFLPWRKEENLYGSFETYEEQFKANERLLTIVRKKYEKHNEDLEGAQLKRLRMVNWICLTVIQQTAIMLSQKTRMIMGSLTQTGPENIVIMILDMILDTTKI